MFTLEHVQGCTQASAHLYDAYCAARVLIRGRRHTMALADGKPVGCFVRWLVRFNAVPMAKTSPSLGGIYQN